MKLYLSSSIIETKDLIAVSLSDDDIKLTYRENQELFFYTSNKEADMKILTKYFKALEKAQEEN